MSNTGRKNILSDQYKLYKMKEIIKKEKPKYDNWILITDTLDSLCNLKNVSILKEHDKSWGRFEKMVFLDD
jgi:hypothetical protein